MNVLLAAFPETDRYTIKKLPVIIEIKHTKYKRVVPIYPAAEYEFKTGYLSCVKSYYIEFISVGEFRIICFNYLFPCIRNIHFIRYVIII